jgi:hypothetical protein
VLGVSTGKQENKARLVPRVILVIAELKVKWVRLEPRVLQVRRENKVQLVIVE